MMNKVTRMELLSSQSQEISRNVAEENQKLRAKTAEQQARLSEVEKQLAVKEERTQAFAQTIESQKERVMALSEELGEIKQKLEEERTLRGRSEIELARLLPLRDSAK
jgi:chromosome segregation ATPase